MIESKRVAEELILVREELKAEEREQEERYQLGRSVTFASLRLEKSYRELCRSKKIDDVLNLKHAETLGVEMKEFDGTQAKPKIKVLPDRRLKNPIWRAM